MKRSNGILDEMTAGAAYSRNKRKSISNETRRALLIPVAVPIVDDIEMGGASIMYFDQLYESRNFFDYYYSEKRRRRLSWGSFGILYDEYEIYDIVFLNPYDVLTALDAEIWLFNNGLKKIRVRDLKLRTALEFNRYLTSHLDSWKLGDMIIVSGYIAEAVIGNLTIVDRSYQDPLASSYVYGRVIRIINKLDIDTLINMSELIFLCEKVKDPRERVKTLINLYPVARVRWPWYTFGLIVSVGDGVITVFDAFTSELVSVNDMLEVRSVNYTLPGFSKEFPLLVVRRFRHKESVESIIRSVSEKKSRDPRLSEMITSALLEVKGIKTDWDWGADEDEIF